MSGLMLKMAADFLKITPEQINEMIADGQKTIHEGLAYLKSVDARLARLEEHAGIVVPVEPLLLNKEESDNGEA